MRAADPDISDELFKKIIAYVEREAGLDAPLAPEDELMVRDLLKNDLTARRVADEERATTKGLRTLFDDLDTDGMEVSDELIALVRRHDAKYAIEDDLSASEQVTPEPSGAGNVVDLRRAVAPPISYGWMAAAASIMLLVVGGIAASHFYDNLLIEHDRLALQLDARTAIESSQNDALQLARADAKKWRFAADSARYEGDQAAIDLADAQYAISGLKIEQAMLQDDYESILRAETTTRTQSEAELQQAEQKREQLLARIQELGVEVTNKQQALASSEAGRGDAGLQIASLEAELTKSKSWINQVVGYHRMFASQPREFLVERTAAETDAIRDMLAPAIERGTEIPDLSSLGITFAGARLLNANGKPVAQLVYLDPNDQPLALCIMPLEKEGKEPTSKQADDLNLVDWRDGKRGFLLIGGADAELMTEVTEKVRPYYEL